MNEEAVDITLSFHQELIEPQGAGAEPVLHVVALYPDGREAARLTAKVFENTIHTWDGTCVNRGTAPGSSRYPDELNALITDTLRLHKRASIHVFEPVTDNADIGFDAAARAANVYATDVRRYDSLAMFLTTAHLRADEDGPGGYDAAYMSGWSKWRFAPVDENDLFRRFV
jgi:hypothetical protein